MQEFKDLIKSLNGTFLIVKAKLFSALNNSNQLYIWNKDKIKDTKKLVINFTSFSLKFYLIYL